MTTKKKKGRAGFENYDLVEMPDVVNFGTFLYMRKDERALKIVFPTGTVATFAPLEENPALLQTNTVKD